MFSSLHHTSKLIAFASLVFLLGCQKAQPPAAEVLPVMPVRVERIELKPHVATEDVVGTVHPKLQSAIEAKVSGQIEKMTSATTAPSPQPQVPNLT